MHAKQHLGAVPGTQGRGIGVITDAAVQDIRDCAAANGVDISAVDPAPFVGKTLSDYRDALAAAGVIPAPVLPGADFVNQALEGAANVATHGIVLVGIVALILFGLKRILGA